ncbi:VWA-like domain-containing protein [Rhodobacter sp. Har01]|uniref:vWA domain-containing protein n=1 Tax=Rhodobacter sp. Har01 TaxID=2883999 RepID=UPI001D08774B|nr:VWA-like domain-containing protein [Rhodobacter sp. Har01]MCB6179278.1 VWA-like domain-containing protein [Rhodobacter sp. Har01]
MTGPSARAARAIAHLGEVDAALAVLALWCRHRDGDGLTRTEGDTITYGPAFERLALPEQVGLVAHHVLHVALRHSARSAALAERLGTAFDAALFGLAADGIINDTLILAGHAIPRPAVTLTDLLEQAGIPEPSPVAALERWDADRLAMALHSDPKRAERLRDWGRTRGFAVDLAAGEPQDEGRAQSASDWRNHILRALEAGRKAGTGIGRLGAILADLAPDSVPWEVHLRGLLARALTERPHLSWRRPSGRWVARMAEAERTGGPVPVFEPGRQRMDHRPRIVIGLDTSSSIDAQTLRLFTAEAEAIARRTGAEAHLLAFDEVVFAEERLDQTGWTGLRDGQLRTGGGTDFHDLFHKAAKLRPSLAVILTDLDAPLPPAPGFPLLWAVPRAGTDPPYGRVLRIGDAQGCA